MTNKTTFWVFGIFQHVLMGIIIFLLFRSLNMIHGEALIGLDTHILVSTGFPLFALLTKYSIYAKR